VPSGSVRSGVGDNAKRLFVVTNRFVVRQIVRTELKQIDHYSKCSECFSVSFDDHRLCISNRTSKSI
jgi:hypothetical protein